MTIGILGAHPDDADRGSEAFVEFCALIPRPVVTHFDHVDPRKLLCNAHAVLRPFAEIPQENRAQTTRHALPRRGEHHHHAGIVSADRVRSTVTCARTRTRRCSTRSRAREDHVPPKFTKNSRHSSRDIVNLSARLGKLSQEPLVAGTIRRRVNDPGHRPHHGGRASDVVKVEVGQHQKINGVYSRLGQTGFEQHRFCPGIDQGHHSGATNQHSVTLTNVTDSNLPPRRSGQIL